LAWETVEEMSASTRTRWVTLTFSLDDRFHPANLHPCHHSS
jgi:hypothetical protein